MKSSHIIILMAFWCLYSPVLGQVEGELRAQRIKALQQDIETDLTDVDSILVEMKALITRPDTSIINGYFGQAKIFSEKPDAQYVGVYLRVDEEYKYAVEDLVLPIKTYFDQNNVPAILIKQEKPLAGNGAQMWVFIDGKNLEGDLSTGGLSLYGFFNDHEKWFEKIKKLYRLAQQ